MTPEAGFGTCVRRAMRACRQWSQELSVFRTSETARTLRGSRRCSVQISKVRRRSFANPQGPIGQWTIEQDVGDFMTNRPLQLTTLAKDLDRQEVHAVAVGSS